MTDFVAVKWMMTSSRECHLLLLSFLNLVRAGDFLFIPKPRGLNFRIDENDRVAENNRHFGIIVARVPRQIVAVQS